MKKQKPKIPQFAFRPTKIVGLWKVTLIPPCKYPPPPPNNLIPIYFKTLCFN